MQAVIMAGGKGTCIADSARDIPTPMLPLCGKPVLERQIEVLRRAGCRTAAIGNMRADIVGTGLYDRVCQILKSEEF